MLSRLRWFYFVTARGSWQRIAVVMLCLLLVFVSNGIVNKKPVVTPPTTHGSFLVYYGPGDWIIGYLAGKAADYVIDHWNDPNAFFNAPTSNWSGNVVGGGGGGAW